MTGFAEHYQTMQVPHDFRVYCHSSHGEGLSVNDLLSSIGKHESSAKS